MLYNNENPSLVMTGGDVFKLNLSNRFTGLGLCSGFVLGAVIGNTAVDSSAYKMILYSIVGALVLNTLQNVIETKTYEKEQKDKESEEENNEVES